MLFELDVCNAGLSAQRAVQFCNPSFTLCLPFEEPTDQQYQCFASLFQALFHIIVILHP